MFDDFIYLILLVTPWLILIFESLYKLFNALRNRHSDETIYQSLAVYHARCEWDEFMRKADQESKAIDKYLAEQAAEWEQQANARNL